MGSPAFVEHCIELLAPLGAVRVGRMFSGHGFYVDGVFMALSIGDRLYLKTGDGDRARLAGAGSEPFAYEGPRGTVTTSYWSAPAEAMDSPALMLPWARAALQAALAARALKPPRRKSPARTSAKAPAGESARQAPVKPRGDATTKSTAPPARKPAQKATRRRTAKAPAPRRGG